MCGRRRRPGESYGWHRVEWRATEACRISDPTKHQQLTRI